MVAALTFRDILYTPPKKNKHDWLEAQPVEDVLYLLLKMVIFQQVMWVFGVYIQGIRKFDFGTGATKKGHSITYLGGIKLDANLC